ncbi:MAG TPA: restriction endonuclease [Candidatus Paceibacterota bacterium]|nr:restriction endonuclease [Candidatus Paceibacterota bacterium]
MGRSSMIDFTELPHDGRAFEQLVREMLLIYDAHPQWTGQGPDQGRDIIATEKLKGPIAASKRTWLVQCKHFAHANRSVGRDDVGSVVDDCRQVGATAYLLACSTQPSSGLVTKLKEIAERPENGLTTLIWDSVDIEKRLQEPRFFGLAQIFFPRSLAATPWKLYNRGAPNVWTAQYKGYFLHLTSRIAGAHPRLQDCERIIEKLESIHLKGEHEYIRPRAIYFDDKNENYSVFADYLVPHDQKPSFTPQEFNCVLEDGKGLYEDGGIMWYCTYWDIALKRILPFSDHFNKDHYDFYNPHDGTFRTGGPRGDWFLGDTYRHRNDWL